MSARRNASAAAVKAVLATAALALCLAVPAWCDGVPTPEEAVAKAFGKFEQDGEVRVPAKVNLFSCFV